MANIYEWGLEVIKAVQTFANPGLTTIMETIAFLGDTFFYMILMAFIIWCIDEKKGLKMGTVIISSAAINNALKYVFKVPRPFVKDPSVGIGYYDGFSTPSGHSQNSAAFWSYFAYSFNKLPRISRFLLAIGIPILMGFTRIYLGLHYPTDILLGWILGYLISLTFIFFFEKVLLFLKPLRWSLKILTFACLALLFNALTPENTSMSGALFGALAGWILLKEKMCISFSAKKGTIAQKFTRFILGIIIVVFLYFALKIIFPGNESEYYHLFRFIRYTIVGLSITCLSPLLFLKLKLA